MRDLLDRRRILAGTVAALTMPVAALPAVAASTDPDAELVALCRRCLAETDFVNNDPSRFDWDDDEIADRCDAINDMEAAVILMAPVTLAGLAAKAAFVGATLDTAGADLSDPECHHARLERSLYDNIRTFAGEAAYG